MTNIKDQKSGTAQTTDATTGTLITYTLPVSSVLVIEAFVSAKSQGGLGAGYILRAAARRPGDGNAILINSAVADSEFEDATASGNWSAQIDVDGTTFRVRVTGESGVTVDWFGTVSVVSIS